MISPPGGPDARSQVNTKAVQARVGRRRQAAGGDRTTKRKHAVDVRRNRAVNSACGQAGPAAPGTHIRGRVFQEIPEQSRHHRQPLAGDGRQHVLVRRVLRTRRDTNAAPRPSAGRGRRRSNRWAASRRGWAGWPAARRSSRAIDAATRVTQGWSGSRRVACIVSMRAGVTLTFANPCRSRCARSAGMNSPWIASDDEAQLQVGHCARGECALTGCSGLPVLNASTSRLFHAKTRSAGVRPGSPQSRIDRRTCLSSPGSMSASARRTDSGIGGGRKRVDEDAAARIDQRCDRVGEDRAGVGEQAAPVAGVMAAFAQVDGQVEVERAARAQEQRRPRRAEARARRRR